MNQIDPIQDEEKWLTKTHWIIISMIGFLSLYMFLTDETRHSDDVSQKYVKEYKTICSHINSHANKIMKTTQEEDFDIEGSKLENRIVTIDNLRIMKDDLVFDIVHDDRLASDAKIFEYTDHDCQKMS